MTKKDTYQFSYKKLGLFLKKEDPLAKNERAEEVRGSIIKNNMRPGDKLRTN
jgi:hypothetical protein